MLRYHRIVNGSARIFIIVSALLYIAFTSCDIFFHNVMVSSGLKFTAICLCFLYTLLRLFLGYRCDRNPMDIDHSVVSTRCLAGSFIIHRDQIILAGAFLFTVISDIFLLFTDRYEIGVLSFCVVQLIHLYRIRTMSNTRMGIHLLIRFAVSAAMAGLAVIMKIDVDFLLCITVFYFINFVGNIGLLIWMKGKTKVTDSVVNVSLYLLGMILFILCDVSVGIYNLTYYVELSGSAYKILEGIAAFGMWGFYLPGQVCIALSTKMK